MDPTEEQQSTEQPSADSTSTDIQSVAAETPTTISSTSDPAQATTELTNEIATETNLLSDIWGSASNLIDLGGPVVMILIVISIFGFAVALFKFFQFSSLSLGRFKQMHDAIDLWSSGDNNGARGELEKIKWPLARTVEFGLENRTAYTDDQMREEITRQANNFINPYAKFLRPLELIYYLAPVLGLLGTVLGMIEAFKGLESSSGLDKDSTALAGGIWEALLTTAVGLSIAIPFTLIHAWLESRLDNLTQLTSDLLTRVLTIGTGKKNS